MGHIDIRGGHMNMTWGHIDIRRGRMNMTVNRIDIRRLPPEYD